MDYLLAALVFSLVAAVVYRARRNQQERARRAIAAEAEGLRRAAAAEAAAERARAEVEARQTVLAVESQAHEASLAADERRRQTEAELARRALAITGDEARVRERESSIDARAT